MEQKNLVVIRAAKYGILICAALLAGCNTGVNDRPDPATNLEGESAASSTSNRKYSDKRPGWLGYPTVEAAYEGLKARSDVRFRTANGWTIADDDGLGGVWSFTNPQHPAHPAVVKRWPVEEDGVVSIKMDVLCQADKSACDKLVADFQVLNTQMREFLQKQQQAKKRSAGTGPALEPSPQQKRAADKTKDRYLAFLDRQQFGDAYDMSAPGLKVMIDREAFVALQQRAFDDSGRVTVRTPDPARWYDRPPPNPAPGIFAIFPIRCKLDAGNNCTEVLILQEQPDGDFAVARYERTIGLRSR